MNVNKKIIGMDIGGSHATAGLFDPDQRKDEPLSMAGRDIDSGEQATDIIGNISDTILELMGGNTSVQHIGIAFPGPFDYANGVSAICNVGGKFQSTFGLHVQQALSDATGLAQTQFRFKNDAHCFAIGAWHRYGLAGKNVVFLTLGTGFGSAFYSNDKLVEQHPGIPASGAFFNQPFEKSIADDYFSTRWILGEYAGLTGKKDMTVRALAEDPDSPATYVFNQFGKNLGSFLQPWLQQFNCDVLVLGGNISKASHLFEPSLRTALTGLSVLPRIISCSDTESCILSGAAFVVKEERTPGIAELPVTCLRKSEQALLPLQHTKTGHEGYQLYPAYRSGVPVFKGFDTLAAKIANDHIVVMDGFGSVYWERFRRHLHEALQALGKKVFWYDISMCLRPVAETDRMIAGSLNEKDPLFGKRFEGELADFFDPSKLELLQPDADADICIVYGTGATLSGWKGTNIYIDVPRNEIQYRSRAGHLCNIGAVEPAPAGQMYKRFYFIDWPMLAKHKDRSLPNIDIIVDEQRIDQITWMEGHDLRDTLRKMMKAPLRARPWFEAGVWGGQWMKQHFKGLNKEEVNYAWSFELITPENGIVIEGNDLLLEVSFDLLLFSGHDQLLGKAAKRFGKEFPIRFDFLDTMDGGNLSLQCHPRTDYIREHFGEKFTQDETYYILDNKDASHVYLGFREDIDPGTFRKALDNAQAFGTAVEAEKYVQKFPSKKHDLFLIPAGTVHASGKNNLVLEISSTPYIFTFKMYDWQRLDLNGKPRPINIGHAMNNLDFSRKGAVVAQTLISHPVIATELENGQQVSLPTHPDHFYKVDRYEFTGSISIATNGQCHCCMLVEGDRVEVTAGGTSVKFEYAETFIIPAHAESYTITHNTPGKAYLVVASVKDEAC